MSNHINKSACRKTILSMAEMRHHKFNRVGSDVFDAMEDLLRNWMQSLVASHPSKGKTIMMGTKKRSTGKADDESIT